VSTIVFTNIKGGSGKTTLALNVAASLKGSILLLDCDPQHSVVKWVDSAEEPLSMVCVGYDGENPHREIQKMEGQYDHIIVDTPPSGLAVGGHTTRIHRQNLVVKAVKARLAFAYDLGIKRAVTIVRDF
jgi:cellulose biosynthesis protein BcsQ